MATVSLWMVLVDWVRPGGARPVSRVLFGLVLGFAGLALLVGPKDLPANIVAAVHLAFKKAMADPRVDTLLDSYIQAPWYKSPAEYRAFAESYFVEVKPLLIKAGLAKG